MIIVSWCCWLLWSRKFILFRLHLLINSNRSLYLNILNCFILLYDTFNIKFKFNFLYINNLVLIWSTFGFSLNLINASVIQHYTFLVRCTVSYYYSVADLKLFSISLYYTSLNVWNTLICVHVDFIYFSSNRYFF